MRCATGEKPAHVPPGFCRQVGAGHASLEDTFLALIESDGGERVVAA
jgi:hypothetical protein